MMDVQRPIAVDLFCGAGGMSVGFEQAGFDVVLAIDRDAHHVATHHRNFPYGQSLLRSVADVSGHEIKEWIGREEIDLVYGGPPCQGFSSMGLRDSVDPRNSLVGHFCRVVAELQPKSFVMENVPGMRTGSTSNYFELAVEHLRDSGYELTWPVQSLNAKDFGVPQDRKRLFLIGVRKDVSTDAVNYPSGPPPGQPPRPTVAEALRGLPVVEESEALFGSDVTTFPPVTRALGAYAQVARGIEPEPNDFPRPRIWNTRQCSGSWRTRHTPKTIALYAATATGTMVPGHKLPRLDPMGLCPTLRAGTDSARGAHTAPRPIHPSHPRVITAREAARLHGYPDWFSFFPKKWHAYRQIGNSVCPPVARAIGLEILTTLDIDPRVLARPSVELHDIFELSVERPKTTRRIPTANECPQVVEYLWQQARKSDEPVSAYVISVERIREAIEETGASLPRLRPEQFLSHVARYRNVEQLLMNPLNAGFSIALATPNDGSGRFVDKNAPGSITNSDDIRIRSSDVTTTTTLDDMSPCGNESDLAELLQRPDVIAHLTENAWRNCRVEPFSRLPKTSSKPFTAKVDAAGRDPIEVLVFTSTNGRLPRKSRISATLRSTDTDHAIVMATPTSSHVFVARFELSNGFVEEIARAVYSPRPTSPLT